VANPDSRKISITSDYYNIQPWTDELHSRSDSYTSPMRRMDCISFEVGGWYPGSTSDSAAEYELVKVFVAQFMDSLKKAAHYSEVTAPWTEGERNTSKIAADRELSHWSSQLR
jgi:hypothetical protein